MDEAKKDIAKRFFILLYLFLTKNYEKIELVFIRHHTSAKEVNEEEFFYSRETGGTVVSSALELMSDIIEARYPPEVGIFMQRKLLMAIIGMLIHLIVRNYCKIKLCLYCNILLMLKSCRAIIKVYGKCINWLKNAILILRWKILMTVADIYPVFHELFKRKTA